MFILLHMYFVVVLESVAYIKQAHFTKKAWCRIIYFLLPHNIVWLCVVHWTLAFLEKEEIVYTVERKFIWNTTTNDEGACYYVRYVPAIYYIHSGCFRFLFCVLAFPSTCKGHDKCTRCNSGGLNSWYCYFQRVVMRVLQWRWVYYYYDIWNSAARECN